MDSVSFTPGKAFLSSLSRTPPWAVFFEDEGDSSYFYALDTTLGDSSDHETQILDAVLIYSVRSIPNPSESLASIVWTPDGIRAALYINGNAQAIFDFAQRRGYCRSGFPNFLEDNNSRWHTASHVWNEEVLSEFEAAIYV